MLASQTLPENYTDEFEHSSSIMANRRVSQAIQTTEQTKISGVRVAGRPGETAFRVMFLGSMSNRASQVTYSADNVAPDSVNGSVYDIRFPSFIKPPGDFFVAVQGVNTDWYWYGQQGAGGEKSFDLITETATAHPGRRAYNRGHDSLNWAIGQVGTSDSEFNQSVAHLPVDDESTVIINQLQSVWLDGGQPTFMQIGMGKHKNNPTQELFHSHIGEIDSNTLKYSYALDNQLHRFLDGLGVDLGRESYWLDQHTDRLLAPFPATGRLDGVGGPLPIQNEDGNIVVVGGDAHIYLLNLDTGEAWEYYKSNGLGLAPGHDGAGMSLGLVRRFDFTKPIWNYPGDDCCTSANARGGAYIPFLFGPDDVVASGGAHLGHQLGFTMNNAYTRPHAYWGAATHNPLRDSHFGEVIGDPDHAMPYGCQMRLKKDFVINPAWPPALRAILETLKIYGMTHLDGSDPGMLVATNDRLANAAGWNDPLVAMNPTDLFAIADLQWLNFDVVKPTRKMLMGDCDCRRVPPVAELTL